jgi:hypothetical protein
MPAISEKDRRAADDSPSMSASDSGDWSKCDHFLANVVAHKLRAVRFQHN